MHFVEETVQPMAQQLLSHGLPTIDTSDENYGIWIPGTRIRGTPNITHWSASEHDVVQGKAVGDAMA